MKRHLFWILNLCGFPALLRFWHRRSLTIVLYHGVAPRIDSGIYNYRGKFISPDVFTRQIALLKSWYTILPLDEAMTRYDNGTLPDNPLAITFDDGYRNFYEFAYPILKSAGVPATVYLATDFVCRRVPLWVDRLEYAIGHGTGSKLEKISRDEKMRDHLKTLSPERREAELTEIERSSGRTFDSFDGERAVYEPLSREEIAEMSTHGISYGAHTRTHPILATQPEDAQKKEIEGSRSDIQAFGVPVSTIFAYPNGQTGDWNQTTEKVLEVGGFTHALTTLEGVNNDHTHPFRLRRFALDATEDIATFANIVSGVRLFLKSLL